MDILKQGRSLMSEKMHDKMIQHSVFAAIVFLIVAHPKTFSLVDSVIKVRDKNILLLVHALVVGLLMYFGSLYLFNPAQKILLEGIGVMEKDMKNGEKVVENVEKVTGKEGKSTVKFMGETAVDKNIVKSRKLNKMTIEDAVKCLERNNLRGGS